MGPSVAAVIVAAGRGLRAGGNLPKQYRELAGEPVIRSSLSLFAWHGQIGAVQAVIHPDDRGCRRCTTGFVIRGARLSVGHEAQRIDPEIA